MINVFICTYNPNHVYLKRTVNSILSQDLEKTEWTLTIIDNNSTDSVAEIDFVKELKINTVVEKQQGLTAARRCAASIATGDLLVFVDDDNILDSNYLSVAKQTFAGRNKDLGIISGSIYPEYEQLPGDWFARFEPMLAIRKFDDVDDLIINTDVYYNLHFPIGAGMVIKAALINDYYSNHLSDVNYIDGRKGNELTSGEDIDLDLYAHISGYKIGVNTKLKIAHIIPSTRTEPRYIIKLAIGNLKSGVLINKKWMPIIGHDVFTFLHINYLKLYLGMFIYRILSFNTSFNIRYHIFKEILRYKRSAI